MEKAEILAIYEDMTALHAKLSESLDVLDRLMVKLEFSLPEVAEQPRDGMLGEGGSS